MGENSNIGWTDHTHNPWWGCARVSEGCQKCYAETFANRLGLDLWGKTSPRRFFGDDHWAKPLRWNRKAIAVGERHRVFCASMADVFEDRDDLVDERARLFDLIEQTTQLDWLLLTKRPENVAALAARWMGSTWPANVWLGTTVEHQDAAERRIPILLEVPARLRFLSCEPLLGPVDVTPWLSPGPRRVDWVIAGGESGATRRAFDVAWAEALLDQCAAAGVPFFFKQHGGRTPNEGGCLIRGAEHKQFPTAA
ncbi:MAG TPA: phage Gp37/Gp68 family protein [Acidimicrobiales bacterium]|nr:phage Gp37/Gp68 family protein [Acidimicrobiales bacterium]